MILPFKDVQYVYTNKCNLAEKTNYCIVPKNNIRHRALLNTIQTACSLFKKHNLQVKVLGGNPSDEDDFGEFIEWMNYKGLDYVITDNAVNVQKLIDCNVKGVMFSLDTLGESDIGGCSYIKSMKAKGSIMNFRNSFDYVGANVVINTLNIGEIPEIIEFLTEHDSIANLCPLIVGKNDNYKFRVPDSPHSLDKLKNRHSKIKVLVKELIEMKKSGYKIGVPEEYLEMLPNVILKNYYNWNCYYINQIPILRVNTDLSLMVCSDLEGDIISKYSIFDIETKFDEINKAWINDEQKRHCCENNGCYWSNIAIADIYRRKGFGTLEATRKNL